MDADQIFVNLKRDIVVMFPVDIQPIVSAILSIAPILIVFPTLFAITTILERKGLGRIQNRLGPNRVGPCGILQPVADGLKTLVKETITPRGVDPVVYFFAPVILIIPTLLVYSVIPFGRNMAALDLPNGVLFFFAVGAGTELSVFMAGWSSRNKYSLLGAMRAIAQMISYELPLILSAVPVLMIAGTLSTTGIVEAQAQYWHGLPSWYVFTPWGFAGFIMFLIAAAAESNRSPFDLPEGESEIIAGYYIEYSGFKFALFFLGEYLGLFAVCGLGITLFLGGWSAPLGFLQVIPSYIWFFVKLLGLVCFFIWVRGTMPRLRMDQLMNFAWKFLLPMSLINIVATALWRYSPNIVVGTLVSAGILAVCYFGLGKFLLEAKGYAKRSYRYAS